VQSLVCCTVYNIAHSLTAQSMLFLYIASELSAYQDYFDMMM